MKKYQKTRSTKRAGGVTKRALLVGIGALVVLLGIMTTLEWTDTIDLIDSSKQTDTSKTTDSGETGINFNPPTEQEKQAGEEQKKEIVEEEEKQETPAPPPDAPAKKAVKPVIVSVSTDNGQVDVRGFVSGVFEEGGTCTAHFTKGSARVTKTSTGFEDFNKTTCRPIVLSQSELGGSSSGWSVSLQYTSSAAEGTSDATAL